MQPTSDDGNAWFELNSCSLPFESVQGFTSKAALPSLAAQPPQHTARFNADAIPSQVPVFNTAAAPEAPCRSGDSSRTGSSRRVQLTSLNSLGLAQQAYQPGGGARRPKGNRHGARLSGTWNQWHTDVAFSVVRSMGTTPRSGS
jgi:hypothetical protein